MKNVGGGFNVDDVFLGYGWVGSEGDGDRVEEFKFWEEMFIGWVFIVVNEDGKLLV